MKLNAKIILIITTFLITSTQCSEVTIKFDNAIVTKPAIKFDGKILVRPAIKEDLSDIFNILHNDYENNFKPLWIKHYSPLIPPHQTIDQFITEKENNNKNALKNFIERQANGEEYSVLVAYTIESNPYDETESAEEGSLAGYCRFKKENQTTLYMNNILTHSFIRKMGLAKILIDCALSTWDTVNQCKFHTLIHDDFINQLLCSKKNCQQTGIVSFDSTTEKINTNPNAPKTHYEYTYTIKK
jgi:hypothetical protein